MSNLNVIFFLPDNSHTRFFFQQRGSSHFPYYICGSSATGNFVLAGSSIHWLCVSAWWNLYADYTNSLLFMYYVLIFISLLLMLKKFVKALYEYFCACFISIFLVFVVCLAPYPQISRIYDNIKTLVFVNILYRVSPLSTLLNTLHRSWKHGNCSTVSYITKLIECSIDDRHNHIPFTK